MSRQRKPIGIDGSILQQRKQYFLSFSPSVPTAPVAIDHDYSLDTIQNHHWLSAPDQTRTPDNNSTIISNSSVVKTEAGSSTHSFNPQYLPCLNLSPPFAPPPPFLLPPPTLPPVRPPTPESD
ncbi:hypothetical protein EYF80_009411 [Liparis tanakae]|uniref:Uncharacterized protein n=1 Tax=Liparis tanakae TaxID=230148 RepID=A0A4Z2IRJ9_9TELE|nr:hypothetical protein EYF80_009411 [Liparis tanakae]